jgi:hypothetical protein
MDPKILLCSPINIVKEYCLYDWLDHIKKLSYPVDIFLVDNSLNPAFSDKIRSLGYDCEHEPPDGREARYFMCNSLQKLRERFLSSDYTHFFSLECDIFPPPDITERLLAHDKDIVGTTYWYFSGYDSQLQLFKMFLWHTDYKTHKKEFRTARLTFEEAQAFMNGQCNPIYANGIGCCLIKRWLIEEFPFRVDPLDAGFPDSFFHTDLWMAGIDNFVDTSIIPTHKNSNWNTILGDNAHKKMQFVRGDIKLKR